MVISIYDKISTVHDHVCSDIVALPPVSWYSHVGWQWHNRVGVLVGYDTGTIVWEFWWVISLIDSLIGPADILVSPRRPVERFADLTVEEVSDLFACVHRIAPVLQHVHSTPSLTIAVQDGEHAGQTVPHVHVHMLPRKAGDFPHNDDIYNKVYVCDHACVTTQGTCV